VCCDEKPSIQARHRTHRTLPATASIKTRCTVLLRCRGRAAREAADRCENKDGIVPGDALIEQLMSVEPYSKARRVFVVVDSGSAHRDQASNRRLQDRYRNLILVHTPVHASWLNQAEIYFSIVQRKVLTPKDFPDLDTLQQQLLTFGRRYQQIAAPFQWKFTRADLDRLAQRLDQPPAKQPEPSIRRRTSEPEHVIHRKLSLSNQSHNGERFAERALSAAGTCRLQRRSRFTYLSELIAAYTRGHPFPALT
jgi:hypothetical protein